MISVKRIISLLVILSILTFTGCGVSAGKLVTKNAVYLGVKGYGLAEINKDTKDEFLYRFEVDGEENTYKLSNGTKDKDGNYDYPIQNKLKEGSRYIVAIEDGIITTVEEIKEDESDFIPKVCGVPGERTVKNFLLTGMMPVGTTLYIYGGGWDWQDIGSSIQARTIGVAPDWVRFFENNDASYTYKEQDGDEEKADPATSYYPYGGYNEYYYAGLDCSGYLGWTIYNTLETENEFAKRLSDKGFGEWTQDIMMPDGENGYEMTPGDIMSINGHVWISLGTCGDGSVVIIHSTPSMSRSGQPGGGVQISAVGYDEECEAYALADKYMSEYYPEWYGRYPIYLCDPDKYFSFKGEDAGKFTWNIEDSGYGLTDPDEIREKTPDEVLKLLFAETTTKKEDASSWTQEGTFIDDIENPTYILDIEYKTSEDGVEKEGYYGYFISGEKFYNASYKETDDGLTGEFISYDNEYIENGKMQVKLKEENGNIYMTTDTGEEYLLVQDKSEDNDYLKFFQYGKIYAGRGADRVLTAVYNYLSFRRMGDNDYNTVTIPYVHIIKTDDSDPKEVLVYGDYYLFDFEKQEDTLVAVSGSHCPGIVHLKKFSEDAAMDYAGQSMDEAFTDEDAEKILGEYYNEYIAVTSDKEQFEKEYAQLIADYVKYNSLEVTKYSLTDGEIDSLPID